jgi:DNA ligase-1
MKTFPPLFGLDSKGRTKVWVIRVAKRGDLGVIVTTYGLLGYASQESRDTVTEGKNIGKRNETTPYEQACAEAESKWNKQADKGYVKDEAELAAVAELPKAMLAHPYAKRGHNIVWPAAVQPKLDGIRLLAHVGTDGVKFYSRNGKPITTVDHLIPSLLESFEPGVVVDGELFNPDMTLQDIVSGAKKLSAKSARLQYWLYDMIDDRPYYDREIGLRHAVQAFDDLLVLVPTIDCADEAEMMQAFAGFLADGFEGAIVRNYSGLYKRGKRSADLQKVKPIEDAEFKIVGFRDGRGKFEGAVIWECETDAGKHFEAVPMGTMEQRREWFGDGVTYMGKMLTVKFANMTPDGVPFHPVGVAVRDYE